MTEVVYSTQRSHFTPGVAYRNPKYFGRPLVTPELERVTVLGDWPEVVAAYEALGLEVRVEVSASVEPAKPGVSPSLANLDGDGDGLPGGSLPTAERGAELAALQAEAEAKGVSFDRRWGVVRLRKEIDAAADKDS